jgi:hypothetical protein
MKRFSRTGEKERLAWVTHASACSPGVAKIYSCCFKVPAKPQQWFSFAVHDEDVKKMTTYKGEVELDLRLSSFSNSKCIPGVEPWNSLAE